MAIEKVIDIKVQGNVDQAVGSLRSQLREAQAEVAALSEKFGVTSVEAAAAARKAAELKDQIGDAKALTDAFNPDAKFRALTSSLSGVAGGFAAVQGGMALFGAQSEEVEATLLKVQSAMALSQGLQAVGESLDSFKQLGAVIKELNIVKLAFNFIETGQIGLIRANTIAKTTDAAATTALATATVASTAATSTATIGLKLFRLALIGTGIGALVVGLVALYQNFDKVKAAVLNVLPGLTDISKFIGNAITSVTDFVGATSEAGRALDKLKSDADATLALNKRFMQEHGSQVDEYTKKKIQAKNDYLEAIKEDGANVAALGQELNRQLAAIDKERYDKRKEAREKNEKEEADAQRKIAEDQYNARQKEAEQLAEFQKQKAEKIQEDFDNLYKANQDAQKLVTESTMTQEQIELAAIDKKYQDQIALATKLGQDTTVLTDAFAVERTAIMQKYATEEDRIRAEQKAKDEKAAEDTKIRERAVANAKLDIAQNTLALIGEIAGKGSKVGKALALAQATISGYQGVQNAYTTAQASPITLTFPAYPYIQAGLAGAFSLLQIKKIMSTDPSGSSSPNLGGGGAGGGGGATPPSFNVVGNTGVNQLAGVIGNREAAPVQAYVVANNVTTAQSLDRNIIASATLGG